MREREVTKTVAERLSAEGLLNMQVRYGNQRGPDIEGVLPRSGRRLFVEAKGERGNLPGNRSLDARIAVGEALVQILSLWDRDVVCGIALPFTREFENTVRNIQAGIRELGLHLLLVRDGSIWYLGPKAQGFFPERRETLMEALEP